MRSFIFTLFIAVFTHWQVAAQTTPTNQPPAVSFIYPTNSLNIFTLSNSIAIKASAFDSDGRVTQVRLHVNGTAVLADLQAPYEFSFTPALPLTYTLFLEAIDNDGASTLSEARVIRYVRIFDHITNGIPITNGTNVLLVASNVDATHQKGEPQHAGVPGGKSVWFAWRPTAPGTVTIDTEGSDFDTVLAVYTNRLQGIIASPTNLVEIAANDNDSVLAPLSRVKFEAVANSIYYIAVDGRDGFAGNVQASIRQTRTTIPANDNLASARRFADGFPQINNIGATKEPNEPYHAGNAGGASVWYRVDLFSSVPVRISTEGSTFDTLLAVYTNISSPLPQNLPPTMDKLRLVASNDDGEGTNRTSQVDLAGTGSATYWIAVDGYNGAEGIIRLTVTPQLKRDPAPTNNMFVNATRLVGSSALVSANTDLATVEPGEPPIGARPGKSIWYRWIAPNDGPVYISTEWSSFDTVLGVYTGTNFSSLIPVAFNDDADGLRTSALVFDAIEGVEYRILVAGYLNASGDMVLLLNQPKATLPRMITQLIGGRLSLSITQATETMLMEASSDLVEWRPVRWIEPGEEVQEIEPSPDKPQEFYRLVVIE